MIYFLRINTYGSTFHPWPQCQQWSSRACVSLCHMKICIYKSVLIREPKDHLKISPATCFPKTETTYAVERKWDEAGSMPLAGSQAGGEAGEGLSNWMQFKISAQKPSCPGPPRPGLGQLQLLCIMIDRGSCKIRCISFRSHLFIARKRLEWRTRAGLVESLVCEEQSSSALTLSPGSPAWFWP